MSLTGARGCIFPLLVEPCSFSNVMYPRLWLFCNRVHNKAYVVCEYDVVALSLSNHAI